MTEVAPTRAPRSVWHKLARYAMASVVGVIIGQSVLYLLYKGAEWDAALANVGAVAVSSVPAYLINRYWVWQKKDKNSVAREVVPFWVMAFLGLLLSTLLVHLAEDRTDSAAVIGAANLSGFGVLWIAKFMVLDKVLFAQTAHEPPPLL